MTKKPVKIWQVLICLVIVLALCATLFLPIFSLKLDIAIRGSAEYVNVTGLDLIQMVFGGVDYVTATKGAQDLFIFIGDGALDISQYVNPIFIEVAMYVYVAVLAFIALLFVFTIFNFFGIRLSVFNVFGGLLILLLGIVITLCVVLQNAEAITSVAVEYNFRLSIGAMLIMIMGFVYMMFAPKKRA